MKPKIKIKNMRSFYSLTEKEIEFIIGCIQTYETTPYYKECRDDELIDSIIGKF